MALRRFSTSALSARRKRRMRPLMAQWLDHPELHHRRLSDLASNAVGRAGGLCRLWRLRSLPTTSMTATPRRRRGMRSSGATGQSTDTFSPSTAGLAGTMDGRGCVRTPSMAGIAPEGAGQSTAGTSGRAALDDVLARRSACGVRGARCEWRDLAPRAKLGSSNSSLHKVSTALVSSRTPEW